ncbi:TATA-binding protein-associated factor 2N [Linum grandiflorum]
MGSRDKGHSASHHPPHLSSLVVRPSASDGGEGGGGGGRGGEYEAGEVRHELPPYSRSDRFSADTGYRMRAGSDSPPRRRDGDRRYASEFDHSGGPPRGRDFSGGRDAARFRDSSPPYSRGGRPLVREFARPGPGLGPGPFKGESLSRNNPHVRPREGDWVCEDPMCMNLNFARREVCNKCKKPRASQTWGSPPRRGYPGPPPPPHALPRRPPMDVSPGRNMNGYRSPLSPPPRVWPRESPRDFGPPPRHGGRYPDHDMRRERPDYPEDDYRGRSKFDRPIPAPVEWGHRGGRGRDGFFDERRGFERRLASPPLPPPQMTPPRRWGRELRERSRSPIRGRGGPPPKDFRRDVMMERGGRDDRRPLGRAR